MYARFKIKTNVNVKVLFRGAAPHFGTLLENAVGFFTAYLAEICICCLRRLPWQIKRFGGASKDCNISIS
jgi:hypothetical protein